MIVASEVDPRLWRSFLVTAEELHFGQAADRLFIAQSALSQRILRLEQQLGAALFERTTRKVALTNAGHELQRRLTVALPLLDEAVEAARAAANGSGVSLAVGIDAACRERVTPALTATLAGTEGGSSLRWHEASCGDLAQGVLDRRLDVAVAPMAPSLDGLALVRFFDDELVAHVSPGENGDRCHGIALGDLDGLTVLLSGSGYERHDELCLALLEGAGVRPPTAPRCYAATEVPPGHVALTARVLVGADQNYAVIEPRRTVRFSFMFRQDGMSPAIESFMGHARVALAARGWGARSEERAPLP